MDPDMGTRRSYLAKLPAGLVVAGSLVAASIGTAYARHGADDGPRHHRHSTDDPISVSTKSVEVRRGADDVLHLRHVTNGSKVCAKRVDDNPRHPRGGADDSVLHLHHGDDGPNHT